MAVDQKELDGYFKRLDGAAKHLHLDIADGKFVKSKVFNFNFKLNKNFTYSAHLMIRKPEGWINKHFKDSRIKIFIPQAEEVKDIKKYMSWMKSEKRKVAFALNPETKITRLKPFLKQIDYVLILTVHPGYYGAKFLPAPLKKIKEIKKLNPKIKIIVDGGMHPTTIGKAAKFGADYFVSGSFTSKSEHPQARIRELLKAVKD